MFADRGHGGRRVRGRRRPGADRRHVPATPSARRRPPENTARADGVIAAAWVCLLSPLAAALAITSAGRALPRRAAGWIATASTSVSFVAARRRVPEASVRGPGPAPSPVDGLDVARRRRPPRRPDDPRRPAERLHDAGRLRRRLADRRVLDRLHARRPGRAPLLRVHGAVRVLDAHARPGRQPAAAARRLGPRRPLVLPADRLPPRAAERDRGCEEGVHHERRRRRDDGARSVPADPAHGLARLRLAHRHRRVERPRDRPRRARPARRRRREVGADPAAHVAAGRDGGPDTRERAHPRGDHGDRGRLPDRAVPQRLRARAGRAGHGGDPRRGHARRRRIDRPRPDGHQARDRLLDDVADRLHVRRRRRGCVLERDVPPDDARVLQGAALPRRRARHPRARRRAGHAQDGRPAHADAEDVPVLRRRRTRARRDPAVRRLLLQGPDPRGDPRARHLRRLPVDRRDRRGLPHRALHVPDDLPRLLGRAEPVRARAGTWSLRDQVPRRAGR